MVTGMRNAARAAAAAAVDNASRDAAWLVISVWDMVKAPCWNAKVE